MPLYIATQGKQYVAIALCDRCKMKVAYVDLHPDGDNPALRVCNGCNDQKDPYKKPPRKTEKIALRYPRTEEDLT